MTPKLIAPRRELGRTVSNPDGTFDVSGVSPGTYRLTAYVPGIYGELVMNDVACKRRDGKLYLPPSARYFGCRRFSEREA